MRKQFTFNHRGLLSLVAVVFVIGVVASYLLDASMLFLALGFGLLMLGGVLGRGRTGKWVLSYPSPTPIEGSIAAVGVTFMFAALISAAAHKFIPWPT